MASVNDVLHKYRNIFSKCLGSVKNGGHTLLISFLDFLTIKTYNNFRVKDSINKLKSVH